MGQGEQSSPNDIHARKYTTRLTARLYLLGGNTRKGYTMKEFTRGMIAAATLGLSEAVGAFSSDAPEPVDPVTISKEEEDKAAADETEAEARKRRRGVLRRVFTQPGQNFVQQTNIGKNSILGV